MRRNPLFLKLVLAVFVSALTVLSHATCDHPVSSPPEFVGTWKGPLTLGTATLTFTETTFTILTADASATATETDTGTITSFDTTLKHIQLAVATVTLTGSASAVWHVGDTIFMLYSLSGTTLTIAVSTTAYPADLTGGLALTKQ
ncbi:MAG: hypothetical protein ABSG38_18875 [Spirochaetia bacterium]|jgi:hypothetical protein